MLEENINPSPINIGKESENRQLLLAISLHRNPENMEKILESVEKPEIILEK